MGDKNLGINWPCYGEFICDLCNHKWASNKAWRNYGQKCARCENEIRADPKSLEALFWYNCENCQRVWKARYMEEGSQCHSCHELIEPLTFTQYKSAKIGKTDSYFNKSNNSDDEYERKQGHRSDLCEKCVKYGMDCTQVRQGGNVSNLRLQSQKSYTRQGIQTRRASGTRSNTFAGTSRESYVHQIYPVAQQRQSEELRRRNPSRETSCCPCSIL